MKLLKQWHNCTVRKLIIILSAIITLSVIVQLFVIIPKSIASVNGNHPTVLPAELKDPNSFEFIYRDDFYSGTPQNRSTGSPIDSIKVCNGELTKACVYKFSSKKLESDEWKDSTLNTVNSTWNINNIAFNVFVDYKELLPENFPKGYLTNKQRYVRASVSPVSPSGSFKNIFNGFEDTIFKVEIFLPNSGINDGLWIFARSISANAKLSKFGGGSILTFSGAPILVPVAVVGPASKNVLDTGQLSRARGEWKDAPGGRTVHYINSQNTGIYYKTGVGNGDLSFKDFARYDENLLMKTWYEYQTWDFTTWSWSNNYYCGDVNSPVLSKYFEIKPNTIVGITGTNSSYYNPWPPTFDNGDNSLKYMVASPHLSSDGSKENSGYFSLTIQKDLASCLWGKDASNAKALIQVVTKSGQIEVATTNMKADSETINFIASNFHYSTPVLKISLAKTIMCAKGKLSKTITSSNPKCPSGYKAK